MSFETFSRAFLQGVPDQRKQQCIDNFIKRFIRDLKQNAAEGKTSYRVSLGNNYAGMKGDKAPPSLYAETKYYYQPLNYHRGMAIDEPVITNEDYISAFKQRFPDCRITYEEKWVDASSNTKHLTKGILIDWS